MKNDDLIPGIQINFKLGDSVLDVFLRLVFEVYGCVIYV